MNKASLSVMRNISEGFGGGKPRWMLPTRSDEKPCGPDYVFFRMSATAVCASG